ncbi:hypothetical protein LPJ72_005932 [Coemansia sp. Benny D160-2]|nr:hypothetical protein LPJ72_005932 [Coemansia sp. Benny D160-2]
MVHGMGRFYHHYAHHHCGRNVKGKIILLGVTLWLTSTVIAGIRRSTGWTHNAHPPAPAPAPAPDSLPPASSSSAEDKAMQTRAVEQLNSSRGAAEAQLSPLEAEYVGAAPDAFTREQRVRWVEARRLSFDQHWQQLRQAVQHGAMDPHWGPHAHAHTHTGGGRGVVRWYLGVGERTFDWLARKVAASRRFHWEDPAVSHAELAAREHFQQQHQHQHHGYAYRYAYDGSGHAPYRNHYSGAGPCHCALHNDYSQRSLHPQAPNAPGTAADNNAVAAQE